jgi:type I restriction enzyme S subunit
MKRLSDLCISVKDQCDPAKSRAAVYVGLEHITGGEFFLKRHGKPSDVQSAKNCFQKGDILYGKLRPYLDKAVIAPDKGICSTDILVLRPSHGVCGAFLLGLIHSAEFRTHADQTTNGVNHPRTSWDGLAGFTWNIPEQSEQNKIAAALWKFQLAIDVEAKLVAAARQLKQATMNLLFTRGLRGEQPVETEVGWLPGSWQHNALGKISEITYGAQAAVASALDPSIGTPIFTNINITNEGKISLDKLRYYKVPEHQRERLILKKGDVLFNWRSGSADHVGKTAILDLDGEYTYSSFILRFRVHSQVTNAFLYRYLHYIKSQGFFSNRRNVSSINSVFNASLAATIPIYFAPDTDEQDEIVGILQTLDQKILVHERKRAALQDLFQTMLHNLMTARIRVNKLDIDTSEVATTSTE